MPRQKKNRTMDFKNNGRNCFCQDNRKKTAKQKEMSA